MAKKTEEKEKKETAEQKDDAQQNGNQKQAQSVEFSEAPESPPAEGSGSIEFLLDMDCPITVAVGQTELPVRQLLQFGPGSVVKLDKPIDAPADLYLRDVKFATGDVVVVDGCFAVRIKQILGVEKAEGKNDVG